QDETDGLPWKLEIHRHRHETGTHDPEIGSEKFSTIGGKDADPIAARKATLQQRARDAIGHDIEPSIAELARPTLAAEIDDGNLVEVITADEVAEIGEVRKLAGIIAHGSFALPLRRCREIGAASAGEEISLGVEHICLGGRELASHAHHLAPNGQ